MTKKPNSKAAEKKRERLALEKLMNSRVALVKAANEVPDPLESLPSFKRYQKKGMDVELAVAGPDNLDSDTRDWMFNLLSGNMRKLYEDCTWGWKDSGKKEELFDSRAKYLVAKDVSQGGDPRLVAFAHFRFDMDYDDEVVYVYEIQLEDSVRRKGLGKFMMQVLEVMAFKYDMRKIMLTVFKHNKSAAEFFKAALGYELDETNPVDDVYEQFDHEILSKFNRRKLAKELASSETAAVEETLSTNHSENSVNSANKATATSSS